MRCARLTAARFRRRLGAFSAELSVAGRGDANGMAEHSGGVAAAVPADLTHRLLDRQVGLTQQLSEMLGADSDQVGHRGLAVGTDEHPPELRGRQMHSIGKALE